MNDAAVDALWAAIGRLQFRMVDLETRLNKIEARIRARLKEEADARALP